MNKIALSPLVQAEWAALKKRTGLGKSAGMKQVLLDRRHIFEVIIDTSKQPHVRLVASYAGAMAALSGHAPAAGQSDMSAISAAAAAIAAVSAAARGDVAEAVAVGVSGGPPFAEAASAPLKPEQISAIEAHLRRCGGQDRFSRLKTTFGVKQAQLISHFTVLAVGVDAVVLLNKPGISGASGGFLTGQVAVSVVGAVQVLEALLAQLRPNKHVIGAAMVYCIDRAEKYAALLARRLASAMGEASPNTLARLYLVSDVLHNANSGRPGATLFRESLQELLPESCEQLGRVWLRRVEGLVERARMESAVRRVLKTWDDWAVFPALFTKGLEALLFSPVLIMSQEVAAREPDRALRNKLQRWFSATDQGRLPYASRLRGLSGKAVPTTVCRARLCHFERYWHRPGIQMPEPDEDPFGGGGGSTGSFASAPGSSTVTGAAAPPGALGADTFKALAPHAGAPVRLQGLKLSAASLNGSLGVCEGFDASSGAWSVRLESGALQAVAPKNLAVLADASQDGVNSLDDQSLDGEPLREEELLELEEAGLLPEPLDSSQPSHAPPKRSFALGGYGAWTQVDHPEVEDTADPNEGSSSHVAKRARMAA
ncbi:unnamed protein product [Polarella glacialis]|uniref:CID domain-containing protein n=1 Tax=Polarella glacialis TaxID=89957 RepID=A0A813FHE8_POLGL|nr:unnamed protein product [Polarella glacialis]